MEDRVARGSTLLCALASGEDAACLEAETDGDGWHPGLETSQPMKLFQSFFKSEPGATLDESLDDCRIVGVCDVSRHEFDLPTPFARAGLRLISDGAGRASCFKAARRRVFLVRAVDAHAKGEGLAQVILHVEDDNDAAIAFYEAQNFGRVKVDRELRQFGTALGLNPDIRTRFRGVPKLKSTPLARSVVGFRRGSRTRCPSSRGRRRSAVPSLIPPERNAHAEHERQRDDRAAGREGPRVAAKLTRPGMLSSFRRRSWTTSRPPRPPVA